MRQLFLITLFLGINLSTTAQLDYLEPENGFLSSSPWEVEYFQSINRILFENLQENTDARVIVMPSFGKPEYLVSIDTKEGESYLTYRIVKEQIWENLKTNKKIKYKEFRMKLDSSLVNKLHELYFLAITKARYPEEAYLGTDGINYIFISSKQFYGIRSAKTWSPYGGKLLELVQITDWLADCAKKSELIEQDKMETKIRKLIENFKN